MHGIVLIALLTDSCLRAWRSFVAELWNLFSQPMGHSSHAEHDDERAWVRAQGPKIMATTDPDGWKVVFVDNEDFLAELK